MGTVDVVPDWRLPGELERDGRFALTQEGGGAATARIRLYDTDSAHPVPLDIDEPRSVTAARFAPDHSVVMLFEPPGFAGLGGASLRQRRTPSASWSRGIPAGGARSLLPR